MLCVVYPKGVKKMEKRIMYLIKRDQRESFLFQKRLDEKLNRRFF